MKSVFFTVVALVAFAFVNTACGGKKHTENDITFMYWGDLKEIQIIEELVKDFEKENPPLKVINQRAAAGGGPYDEKMTTLFAANRQPDVFLMSSLYAAKYMGFSGLADVTERANNSKVLGIKDFYPSIIEDFSKDGKLYGIPRDVAPVSCIYYNKAAFKEVGLPMPHDNWTWDDFLVAAKKLQKVKENGNVERWGYVDDWAMDDVWIYSAGGKYFDDPHNPTKLIIDSKEALEGIQFRADLINKHKVMPSSSSLTSMGGISTSGMFITGQVGMFYSGSWKIPEFRDIEDFEWDIVMVPNHPVKKIRGYSGGGSGYCLNAHLDKTKADKAWKLLEFFTKPTSLARFAASGLLQPSNMKVAEGPEFLDGKIPYNKKMLIKATDDVYVFPKNAAKFREVMASGVIQAMELVWRGEKTAKEAIPPAVKQVNEKFKGKFW